jgi:hypothetical protein
MAAAALVFWGIKKLKKGRGSSWLRDLIYWYLPTSLLKGFFMMFRTPVSGSGLNKTVGNNIWNMAPDSVPRASLRWDISVWGQSFSQSDHQYYSGY